VDRPAEPFRRLSNEEFEALSMDEKIAHLRRAMEALWPHPFLLGDPTADKADQEP